MGTSERQALLELYSVERADGGSLLQATSALLAAVMSGSVLLTLTVSDSTLLRAGPWITALIPLPLVVLLCTYSAHAFAQGQRAYSGQALEKELLRGTTVRQDLLGLQRTEKLFNAKVGPPSVGVFLGLQYAFVILITLGVAYRFLKKASVMDNSVQPTLLALAAYVILVSSFIAYAVAAGREMPGEAEDLRRPPAATRDRSIGLVRRAARSARVVVVLIAILVAVDCLGYVTGALPARQRGSLSLVHLDTSTSADVIVFFPGIFTEGRTLTRAAEGALEDSTLIGVSYSRRPIDEDQIADELITQLAEIGQFDSLVLYGSSMGGMVAARVMEKLDSAGAITVPSLLVLDSAPHDVDQVVALPDVVSTVAGRLPGGPVESELLYWSMFATSVDYPRDSLARSELIRRSRHDAWSWGSRRLISNIKYISQYTAPASRDHRSHATCYVRAREGDDDGTIRVRDAEARWAQTYPAMREARIARSPDQHTPLIQRPGQIRLALAACR